MSRINLDDNRTWGLSLGPRTTFQTEQGVQVTADVISPDSPPMILLAPAGAINMRLPPSNPATAGAARKGQIFIFVTRAATSSRRRPPARRYNCCYGRGQRVDHRQCH
jgi:hypothetical protein